MGHDVDIIQLSMKAY